MIATDLISSIRTAAAAERAEITLSWRNAQWSAWLAGAIHDDMDAGLDKSQRNGPRCKAVFLMADRARGGQTLWSQYAAAFTKVTGIPADVVTWQVEDDRERWPASFCQDNPDPTSDTPAGLWPLPVTWIAMLAWVPGFPNPFQVDCLGSEVDVFYDGFELAGPDDLWDYLDENDFTLPSYTPEASDEL